MAGYFRRCDLQLWSRLVRILLVDASPTIRNLQKNALKQLGHTDVIEAEDGIQALAVFVEQTPDLAIVDWNMPNMDGITLVRIIRQSGIKIPLIMCTTEAEKRTERALFRAARARCPSRCRLEGLPKLDSK